MRTSRFTRFLATLLLFSMYVIPVSGQTIDPYYTSDYSVVSLGFPTNVTAPTGALTFKAGDPNTLLLVIDASTANTKLYQIGVVRDGGGHITGFSGATATLFASAPNDDGGLDYGPGGVLFYTGYGNNILGQIKPGSTSPDKTIDLTPFGILPSTGTMIFVPSYAPGAGRLKIASYTAGYFYDVGLTPDGTGTYDIGTVSEGIFVGGGPEGLIYVTPDSPLFSTPSILVAEFDQSRLSAFEVDSLGNPILSTRRTFLTGVPIAGATVDSMTGDILFTRFYPDNRVYVVHGFPLSLTPSQQIENLQQAVQALVSSTALLPGDGQSLRAKLDSSLSSLAKGNIKASIGSLTAFINQVKAKIQSGALSATQGQPLIDAANVVIQALSG